MSQSRTPPPEPERPRSMGSTPTHAPMPTLAQLVEKMREALRLRQYSPYTERTYVAWVARFVSFHGNRHSSSRVRRWRAF